MLSKPALSRHIGMRTAVSLPKADEVAKLEAEKERILQRLPSFVKPAANNSAGKPESGQAEDGPDGE